MSIGLPSTNKPKAKVVLVGASSAGKTSLVTRLTTNSFAQDSVTIGAAFFPYEVSIHPYFQRHSKYEHFLTRFFHNPDHRTLYTPPPPPESQNNKPVPPIVEDPVPYPMAIWDTAGSENYAKLIRMYFRDADCAVICYDITSIDSWLKVESSIENVLELSPDALLVLVATKKDFIINTNNSNYNRCVPVNEVREFALQRGIIVFETSAKLDTTTPLVDWTKEVFSFIAHELAYRQHARRDAEEKAKHQQSQHVDIDADTDTKSKRCC